MEEKDDSIRILEMRIREQMSRSLVKNIRPEHIRYYVSSGMIRTGDMIQGLHGGETGDMIQGLPGGETEDLLQDIPGGGTEDLLQDFPGGETEDLIQDIYSSETEDLHLDLQSNWTEEDGQKLYERLSADAEYIERVGRISQMMESMETAETNQARHIMAKNEYERVCQSLDTEKSSEIENNNFLDAKG